MNEILDLSLEENAWDILKKLMDKIQLESKKYDKLIINAHIMGFLIDGFNAQGIKVNTPKPDIQTKPNIIKIISLKNIVVYLDPHIPWDKINLLFTNDMKNFKIIELKTVFPLI